jgi:hypothetical protein
VQLLAAMKECLAWIVSDEVDRGFLVTTQHHDIFESFHFWFFRQISRFEAVR